MRYTFLLKDRTDHPDHPKQVKGAVGKCIGMSYDKWTMKTVGIIVVISACVLGTTVEEKQIAYTCQEDSVVLEAAFEPVTPHCDQSWDIANKPIASYENHSKKCIPPCKDVFSGKLYLSECVNITFTYGCSNNGQYKETRLHFIGICRPEVIRTNTGNTHISPYGLLGFIFVVTALWAMLEP
ncbi:hypothetical protein UPYG_G00149170 [Umbra pygmaea]|uniref:Uncharacterized protein n=1 Tax=Umbra pygmaea TaxID=75934 RepID=A0ABD0XCU7_UMBPY